VVDRQALEAWLSVDGAANTLNEIEAVREGSSDSNGNDSSPTSSLSPKTVTIPSDISCSHGCLDPRKSASMKCISKVKPVLVCTASYIF
jgi:hypothetical protein